MIKNLILFALINASLQIPHCKVNFKTCKNCQNGLTLIKYNNGDFDCIDNEDLQEIQKIVPNCIELKEDDNTKCEYCERGYALSSSKTSCIKKDHCNEFDENDPGKKCTECFEYYYPDDNGECKRIPIVRCLIGNSKKCSECDEYYYFVEGKCEKIELEHCVRLEEDSSKCEECDEYYHVKDDGECEKNPDHCRYYGNECNYCEEGYYLSDGECQTVTKVEHCEKYDGVENKCYSCAPSYYLDENECKIVTDQIPNCVYYSDADHCEECDIDKGYVPSEEGKCEKYCDTEDICEECEYNYYSFDYGKTCTILDSSLETNDGNRLNSLNFALVILLLFAL